MIDDAAKAAVRDKLAKYFGIDICLQRRIGTFVVVFSMIEQQLEFTLRAGAAAIEERCSAIERATVSDRFKALRMLVDSAPALAREIELAADWGEVLMAIRHTLIHGAPTGRRLERNRSWFGEMRKRPYAKLELYEPVLDAAALAADILLRLLGGIGAHLAGRLEEAAAITPAKAEQAQANDAIAQLNEAARGNAGG